MTFPHLNRRVHLYAGLALLPWFFMYGISSVPFAHNEFFQRRDAATGLPQWTLRSERPLDVAVPAGREEMRSFGARLLREAGIEVDRKSFGTYRPSPSQINVYAYQEGVLQDSWSVVIDIVCVAMIVWIISGLYMWWGLPTLRRWGLLAVLAGTASFVLFTLRL